MRSLVLGLLCLFACKRSEPQQADHAAQTYARLRSFERPTLQSFASEKLLLGYLDTLSWMNQQGFENERAAKVPRRVPRPLDDAHWAVGGRPWLGPRSRKSWEQSLPRLARIGERLFFLHARELVALEQRDGQLVVAARLPLSEAIPPPTQTTILEHGRPVGVITRDPKDFDGRVVWDALFADGQGLVLLASCQDTNAIEIVRVDAGNLQRTSSYRLFFRSDDLQGYRVHWSEGSLLLFFQHKPLFQSAEGEHGYALPALQGPDDPAPRALLQSGEVTQPLMHGAEPRLHTLVRCDTASKLPSCRARAIVGPASYHSLLAEDAAYVWLTAWHAAEAPPVDSVMLRIPGTMQEPGALRVRARDGADEVRMRATAHELRVASASHGGGPLLLFRAEHARFTSSVASLPKDAYRSVADLNPGPRTRDDVEVIGDDALWLARSPAERGNLTWGFLPDMQRVPLSGDAASVVTLGHDQSWLLRLGKRVLVSGSDSWNLHLSLVEDARVLARDVVRDAKRSVVSFGPLYDLGSHDDVHWVAQVHFEQTDAILRVLRASDSLDIARSWRLPRAHERSEPVGMEALALGDHALVRLDGQLMLIGLADEPRLLHSLSL